MPARHTLLLGWGGARPQQLAPYIALHRALGRDTSVFINDGLGALVRYRRMLQRCAQAAAALACCDADDLVVHIFSDNGFAAFCEILPVLQATDAGRRAIGRIRAIILDSSPALYAATPAEFARRFALASTTLLTKRPAAQHRVWSPLLFSAFRLYTLFNGPTVRALCGAYQAAEPVYPRCPHLFLYSDGDLVTPRRDIEAFVAMQRARGVAVRTLRSPTDHHVGFYRADPESYRAAIRELLGA